MFWLSHHHPEELHRTYRFGGLRVCARCLGTYPVLAAAMAAQFAVRAPLERPTDWAWALLAIPAVADWAYGRFRPSVGTNLWRSLTGTLLGLSLSRSLYLHLQAPWPTVLTVQVLGVTAVALPVILATYLMRRSR